MKDAYGLAISTSSEQAASAFDRAIAGYLKARLDTRDHLVAALKADPEFGLAHCLKGYFAMLLYKQAAVPAAAEAIFLAKKMDCDPAPLNSVGPTANW